MAYKTEELKEKALKVIKKYQLVFIEEVADKMGIHKATYYNRNLDECDEIKTALLEVKRNKKAKLRKNWETGNNATLNLALYKLLATKEEWEAIQATKQTVDNNLKGDVKIEWEK